MDRAFYMSQHLSGRIDDCAYRGPYLFHPQTPFDPIGCPDCDASFNYMPNRREKTQPILPPEPAQDKFHEADDESTDYESGGDTLDNGLPKGEKKSFKELISSISEVSRKENEVLAHSPESSGFTILNKYSLENSIFRN